MVSGRVQGVGFRWHTLHRAREVGVTGSVRNLPDGRVAVVAEGERDDLQLFLIWLGQGPPHALVDGTEVQWSAATGEHTEFLIVG
jgi:acylphosphatase